MRPGTQKRAPAGNSRGEDSRQRIVEAALDVFGGHGFEGATTRMLAQSAGVNLAAIGYHFGGKEGLYRAVAEHIVATVGERQGPVIAKARTALDDPALTPEAALGHLLDILDSLAAMLVGAGPADRWAAFVMREQMLPTPAFDIIYQGFQARIHGLCSALVARIIGRDARDPEVRILTTTIIGQILIFRAARAAVQQLLQWPEFTQERIDRIRAVIRRNVTRMLKPESLS